MTCGAKSTPLVGGLKSTLVSLANNGDSTSQVTNTEPNVPPLLSISNDKKSPSTDVLAVSDAEVKANTPLALSLFNTKHQQNMTTIDIHWP